MNWALPLRLDAAGRFLAGRPDPVADTARLILGVAPGERRGLPGFGWEGHRLADLSTAIEREAACVFAEEALRRWAPDLRVSRVEIRAADGRRVRLALRAPGGWSHLEVELRGWTAS